MRAYTRQYDRLAVAAAGSLLLVLATGPNEGEAQEASALRARVEEVRGKVRAAEASQDSLLRVTGVKEGADLGLSIIEDTPEDQWEPNDMQSFLKDMAYHWLSNIPRQDQEAWLDKHAAQVKAPNAHLVVGFIEWKAGRRTQALARAGYVLGTAPSSFAAGMGMVGVMALHYHRGDLPSQTSALRSFIKMAPNNPLTRTVLRSYVWTACARDQSRLAHTIIDETLGSQPNTRAAEAAGQMASVLQSIERHDYPSAAATLEKVETGYWYEMNLSDMILTFVIPAKTPGHRGQLIDAMTKAGAEYPNPFAQPFSQCVIGMTYEVSGQYAEAARVLEQVFKETQEAKEPLVRMAFELHLLAQLGGVYMNTNPERAITYLERFRDSYGKSAGAEFHNINLGHAYLKLGKPDKAYEIFTWLEARRKSGETIAQEEVRGAIQTGLVASLDRLGRKDEAQAMAQQLLAPHGYGQAVSALSRSQRSKISTLLSMMDREQEARQYRPE